MSSAATRSGSPAAETRPSERCPPSASPAAGALAVPLRPPCSRRDGIRVRLPARAGDTRQLLRGELQRADLGRTRQLQGRRRRSRVPAIAAEQRQADGSRARDAGPRAGDRARAQRSHPGNAPVPGDRLSAVRVAGDRDRPLLLVPAAAERCAQHRASQRRPGIPGPRLAGQLPPGDRLGRWARGLAATRLLRGRLHRGAARASAGDVGGGAHRRRRVVGAAAARPRTADPSDHRAARRHPGDHGALLGLQLRLHPHLRRPRLLVERDGAVHLAELLERRQRHCGERGRDAARDGERADRPLAVGAAAGGGRVRTAGGGRLVGMLSRHAFLVIICLSALYPLWFIVSTALKSNIAYQLDPTGFPTHPTFDSLRAIVRDQPMPRWMWNSLLVTVSSVAVSTLVALLAAYAAVFGRFRGHRIFLSSSVALMVVPPVTLLVPMFVLMVDTGWVNHLQSVIVFYTGLLVPFAVFFLTNFFRTVPHELIEAASVEGAGPFTVLRRIVLPLSGAAAFTLVVVQAIWVWYELLIALVFLQNDSARTLMAGLAQFQGRYSTNQPLVLAGALVSIAPVVLLYLSGQRFFVRGLTAGIGK